MNDRHKMAVVAFLSSLLLGCGRSQIEWSEEVKLGSGETIVVARTAKTRPFGEVGGPGGWENEGMTVRVLGPSKEKLPPIWAGRFVPIVLDRDPASNEWFIVASFYSCTSWYDLGRPTLPYTEFRLKDSNWVQQPLSTALIGREANMYANIRSNGQPNLGISEKSGMNNNNAVDLKFRRIVGTWKTNC